jgi:hypothetical protein
MSNHRTAWHVLFVASLREHGPPGFEVLPEQPLSSEPLRADVVVIRRRGGPPHDDAARTLRGFWPLVRHTAVIEFKSPTRPLRAGEVAKLFGYGGQYHALHVDEVGSARNLQIVLVVASVSPALEEELARMDLQVHPIAPGYLAADGVYRLLVVDLSAIVEADEQEDLMRIFVQSKLLSVFAKRFMEQHRMTPDAPKNLAELEDYHAVVQRWLRDLTPAERLEGLAPRERLEGLGPRERLEGLGREDLLLALPDDILRGMSDDFLRTLPTAAQEAIRRRIGRPA